MTDDDIHYLGLDNLKVAWMRIGGANPSPLVFLHGLGDSAIITFRTIALHPSLEGTPALLIDLPGFGYSVAPDDWPSTTEQHADAVIAALDALAVSRAPIMGHSMGGSIAIQIAARRPDLVSRLILAEPLLRPEQSVLGRMVVKRTEMDFVSRGFPMLQLATSRQAARGEKAALGFQEALSRANPAIMYRSASSLLQERSPAFGEVLNALPMPRSVLLGETTNTDLSDLAQDIDIVRIAGAGHSMMSENPDAFAHATATALEADRVSRQRTTLTDDHAPQHDTPET